MEIARLVGVDTLHKFSERLAAKLDLSARYVQYILLDERKPSPVVAEQLERETNYNRLYWLYRSEFGTDGAKIDAS